MHDVKVLCPISKAPGFRLAGVAMEFYSSAAEGRELLSREIERSETGVLLVDEAVVSTLEPYLARRVEQSKAPLVVAIPMEAVEGLGKKYLERVIRRLIGYQVRLK